MTLRFAVIAITAIGSVVIVGNRTQALTRVRKRIITPRGSAPIPPVTYFERYLPKKTSGQGDAL
jgi:predicted alpha/beta hydrolase